MVNRAIFLDRDGVLIANRADYVKSWDEVMILPGAAAALRDFHQAGFLTVIVTNQSAAGRGILPAGELVELNQKIVDELTQLGGWIDRSYICPHSPTDHCDCRKPKPGMIFQAKRELSLDLSASFLVGDAVTDLQAAEAAGVQSILVWSGRGVEQRKKLTLHPHLSPWMFENILLASRGILQPTGDQP